MRSSWRFWLREALPAAHCPSMEVHTESLADVRLHQTSVDPHDVREGLHLRDIDIRRAILAVLLRAEGDLGAADVVARLQSEEGIDLADRQSISPRRRVSDTLRALERRGWCRRVRRGRYVAVPSSMSKSRRWRALNWRRPSVRFWWEAEALHRSDGYRRVA